MTKSAFKGFKCILISCQFLTKFIFSILLQNSFFLTILRAGLKQSKVVVTPLRGHSKQKCAINIMIGKRILSKHMVPPFYSTSCDWRDYIVYNLLEINWKNATISMCVLSTLQFEWFLTKSPLSLCPFPNSLWKTMT